MGIYSSYSDADLAAEIVAFRAAWRAIVLGGDGVGSVKRITDGERTVEYTSANRGDLVKELNALLREQDRRQPGYTGNAIGVVFE